MVPAATWQVQNLNPADGVVWKALAELARPFYDRQLTTRGKLKDQDSSKVTSSRNI
jgi:hypothetical protein